MKRLKYKHEIFSDDKSESTQSPCTEGSTQPTTLSWGTKVFNHSPDRRSCDQILIIILDHQVLVTTRGCMIPTIGGTGRIATTNCKPIGMVNPVHSNVTVNPILGPLSIMLASVQLPSRLKPSVVRHYKGTHPPQGSNHPFFHFNPHLLERFLRIYPRSSTCFLLRYSIMKFSHILVLYLSAMATPSALAVPLRHGDYCPPGTVDVRCIGHIDNHNTMASPHSSGGSAWRELPHSCTPICLAPNLPYRIGSHTREAAFSNSQGYHCRASTHRSNFGPHSWIAARRNRPVRNGRCFCIKSFPQC